MFRAHGLQELPLLVLALALAPACSGGHDAAEKQLAELRAEVTKLRASQAALTERLDAIDIERGSFAKGGASAAPAAASAPLPPLPAARPSDRPDLDVVRLSPSEGDGDVDGDPGRPVVRVVGEGGRPPATLSNKNIVPRPKKGVVISTPTPTKKTDGDSRPVVKP